MLRREYEAALADYEVALNLDPDRASAWNSRGNCLLELNRLDNALFSFEQATKLDPENPEFWFNQGRVHSSLQQWEKAENCYHHARGLTQPDW